jgi:hypothetical protein
LTGCEVEGIPGRRVPGTPYLTRVPETPYLTAWANSGKSGREQIAGPRDPGRFPVFVTCRRWGRFPVFATCPVEILAHSQTIADQGEKKDRHFEFHSSRRTSSTALSPWPLRGFTPGPCNQDPDGAACWSLEGAGPRPARSIRPRLFRAPAGRRQTYDDGRSIARLGYEGGGGCDCPIAATFGWRLQAGSGTVS